MQNVIDSITPQLDAIGKRQAALSATIQAKRARATLIATNIAIAQANLADKRTALADELLAEARGTGTSAAVNAARAAVVAAEKAASAAQALSTEASEVEATVAGLDADVEALIAEAAPLHAKLRNARVSQLRDELDARVRAFNAQVKPMADLMARVIGAEKYLNLLGVGPSIRDSHTGRFCLTPFGSEPISLPTMGVAVDAEAAKLFAEWQIHPEVRPQLAGLPWGMVA
jgi:hypothetical protein